MAKRVLIMGPPGSGKGTQAAKICAKRNLDHVSTGDILREAMRAGSEIGRKVKAVVESGNLVGDELMEELVEVRLAEKSARRGFMLDGFPRTVPQAEALLEMLKEDRIEAVLLLKVPEEAIVERLLLRGRTDDTRETIRHRLEVYEKETEPVLRYLESQGVDIVEIDGLGSVELIAKRIESVLDAVH
jgi:adenylate kinase